MKKPDWCVHLKDTDYVVCAFIEDSSRASVQFVKFIIYKEAKAVRAIGEAHVIISTKGYLTRMKRANLVGPVNSKIIDQMQELSDSKEIKILEIVKVNKSMRGKGLMRIILNAIEEYKSCPTYLYCNAFFDERETTQKDNDDLQMKYHLMGFKMIPYSPIMVRE